MKTRDILGISAVAAVFCATVLSAAGQPVSNTVPWFTGFEADETPVAYTNLMPLINGVGGWYASSDDVIVQNQKKKSGQHAAIIPLDRTIENRFEDEGVTKVGVQMDVWPELYDYELHPVVDTNATAFFYINIDGNFVVHDGPVDPDETNSVNWVEVDTLGIIDPDAIDWVSVGFVMDYDAGRWDLYANGILLTNDIGFVDETVTRFTRFSLYNGSGTSYLDNVYVDLPPNKLVIDTQPLGGPRGELLAAQPVIHVCDEHGNRTMSDHLTVVTVEIVSGDYGELGGTTNVTASFGRAAFTNLTLDGAVCQDYRLLFTGHRLPELSNPYVTSDVVKVTGDMLMLDVQPGFISHDVMHGKVDQIISNDVVEMSNIGTVDMLGYQISLSPPDINWFNISHDSGHIEAGSTSNMVIQYVTENLVAGSSVTTYTGKITFIATNASTGGSVLGSPQDVEVTVIVRPQPTLRVSRRELHNSTMQHYDAPTQVFDIWNASGMYPIEFTISDNVPWLTTSEKSGILTHQRITVSVDYSTASLGVGQSNATITVSGVDTTYGLFKSTNYVDVTLQIKPVAVLAHGASGWTNTVKKGHNIPSTTFPVYNACVWPQGILSYEISSDVPWLSVSPEDGVLSPESSGMITVEYSTAGLVPGWHRGTILLSGTDVGTDTDAINSPARIEMAVFVEETKPLDFSGDGIAEVVAYNEFSGNWHIVNMDGQSWTQRFGRAGFMPAPGDYSGDGVSSLGVYNPANGFWYSKPLDSDVILVVGQFGGPGFEPIRGDFDGDGRQDFALYSEGAGQWYIMTPDSELILWGFQWGGPDFMPLADDFSGDGVDDLALYHEASGNWYIITTDGILVAWGLPWGGPGFVPLAADFTGDGLADLAVYYPALGVWYVTSLIDGPLAWGEQWGGPGFTPLAADYDGDGRADLAVYYNGLWYIRTLDGKIIAFGLECGGYGYVPIGM